MESWIKTAAATSSCRLRFENCTRDVKKTMGVLLICAALVTMAYISLFTLCTPRLSAFLHGNNDVDEGNLTEYESTVKQVFERAAMPNRTVILTTINEAWTNEGAIIDLFLESFRIGLGTRRLLQHLILICVDERAYERCLVMHPHCIRIKTHRVDLSQEQVWLTRNYIKLVWRRIKFLKTALEMDFNFIFTDTDVLWFRDPFSLLQKDNEVDFYISSDKYNNIPWDMHNEPNSGFMYVRANKRTIKFFEYWYRQRARNAKLASQGIFNIMKFDEKVQSIGVNLHFLDPQLFGGFCTITETDMTRAVTMHATCCKGLEAKLTDLRKILERWKQWKHIYMLETINDKNDVSRKNESISPPCNPKNLDTNAQFDAPLACIQSLIM